MDPVTLGPETWASIGDVLSTLWLVVLFIVLFAANMIIGHNLIPSFYASGHIPESLQKSRPIFYALAIISFILALVFLGQVVGDANGTLRMFWDRFWI